MLSDNVYIRICVTSTLLILSVYYPLALVLVILPIFYFGNYIESLILGIIIDVLYGVDGAIVYTSSVFIVFIVIEIAKRRLRL